MLLTGRKVVSRRLVIHRCILNIAHHFQGKKPLAKWVRFLTVWFCCGRADSVIRKGGDQQSVEGVWI